MGIFTRLFGRTLYYPGCVSKYLVKDVQRRHEHLLTMFDIDYIKLPEVEMCCGKPALELGHKDVFKEIVRKNKEILNNQGIKSVITPCPKCYYMFKKYYGIEVKLMAEVILENLEKINKKFSEEVWLFDPCNPEGFEEVYDAPREILNRLGFNVKEFMHKSMCCGHPIKENSPRVAEEMAKQRLERTGKIITICPSCFMHLKQSVPNAKVLEISEVLI